MDAKFNVDEHRYPKSNLHQITRRRRGKKGKQRGGVVRFAPSSLFRDTARRAAPLSLLKKKHLTTSGGWPTCVSAYIPVAGESCQVHEQMDAFTRESAINTVYLINVGYYLVLTPTVRGSPRFMD